MAFDGITIANLARDFNKLLLNGRLVKIAQPEVDELLLTIKPDEKQCQKNGCDSSGQLRLCISASASLPLIYLIDQNKPGPLSAPSFCMLLRKHLQNGRIVSIRQPGLERVLLFEIEHLDEMGDLKKKKLIVEIMGKHSNIIFCDEDNRIIDSIKHVSALVSSVREVLPGKPWFIVQTTDKADPLSLSRSEFMERIFSRPQECYKALYTSCTGLSPAVATEICHRGGVDSCRSAIEANDDQKESLWQAFSKVMDDVRQNRFSPCIVYENQAPAEYAALTLTSYPAAQRKDYADISVLLADYYEEKNRISRIRQRSADLRRIVATALERSVKKYDLQQKQIKDTQNRQRYRVYGELLNTYGYSCPPGAASLSVTDFYSGKPVTIPLDPLLSPGENAKRYFEKYKKQKRTCEALTRLTQEVQEQIRYLESIATALDIAQKEEDLVQIKEELIESGYLRRKGAAKKPRITSRPFHYISSDGFHMYVGKNNLQNEELTFQFASGNDWWFHAKDMPGSHVIVKCEGRDLPDATYEEAARLAAHYSRGQSLDKVEVDYVQRRQVKKVPGAKPGFVIYHTNYSMRIGTDISGIRLAEPNESLPHEKRVSPL